jgi:threonine dehydrogenase-like Zn-dependent dehydrogenase
VICNAMGASKIFVGEPNANRRRLIESLGAATAVLDPKAVNVIDHIRQHGGGVGVDSAIECSGIAAALNISVEAARDRATVVQTGPRLKKAVVDPRSGLQGHHDRGDLVLRDQNVVARDPDDFEWQASRREDHHRTDRTGGDRRHRLRSLLDPKATR